MKIQVEYLFLNAQNDITNTKTSWIDKSPLGRLILAKHDTTEETANDTLTVEDFLEIQESKVLNISKIVMTNRVLLDDIKVGDKLYIAKPAYPDIKLVDITDIGADQFYTCICTYATTISESGINSFEIRSSLMDDGIIPNEYNRSMAFRTYEEAVFYMEYLGFAQIKENTIQISQQ